MRQNQDKVEEIVEKVIQHYDSVILTLDQAAQEAERNKERSSGGKKRADKGHLVESITRELVGAAWLSLGGNAALLEINSSKHIVPIKEDYVLNIQNPDLKKQIQQNIEEYKIKHGADCHVYINKKFVLSIECKAFTENAMLKRILFDAYLLRTLHPDLEFVLLQLESQLGGDYSSLNPNPKGSFSTHALMSYMDDIDLRIITLLEGERKVNKPIHERRFYKPLTEQGIMNAIDSLRNILRRHIPV